MELARRRYRLGFRLFTDAVRNFRWWILTGFPVTFAIAFVFRDELDIAAGAVTASIFMWFLAVWSGFVIHTFLPTKLAAGVTRREITIAVAMNGALLSVAAILVVAIGLFAEYALLSAITEPVLTLGETAAHAARYLLVAPMYCCAGLAIGAAEVRMNGASKLPALLVAGGVLGLVCALYEYGGWYPRWTLPGIALTAALAAAAVLALRAAPVRPKQG